jgi:hypothetical protein
MTRDLSDLARRSHRDACRDSGAKSQSKKPMGYPARRFAVLDRWPRTYSQASALEHPKGGSDKDDTGLERKVDDNKVQEH